MPQESKRTKAVVLLSGGLDSSTALAWAIKEQGWECHTLAFDYGQRHRIELLSASNVSAALCANSHHQLAVDLRAIGGSALTDHIDVPRDDHASKDVPVTYVPARNMIFLSLAMALAETLDATQLVIGANVVDYSGYPDCRPDFLASFEAMANLGTKAGREGQGIAVVAPLITLNKPDIIRLGLRLGVDYGLTHSCYAPSADGIPCRHCDSCYYRGEGFDAVGQADPVLN